MEIPLTKNWRAHSALALLLVVIASLVENSVAREGSSTRSESLRTGHARSSLSKKSGSNKPLRLREGTLVSDQAGYFREDGDGATFISDTGMEFGALPNLNLERVILLLKDAEQPGRIRWSVTGEVTEFSGRNFLLMSRAVYKSSMSPPPPERVETKK